jgi:hypothetical protein
MVVDTYDPTCYGGGGRRIMSFRPAWARGSTGPCPQNKKQKKQTQKRLGT